MRFERPEDFYAVYDEYKNYAAPDLREKHVRWMDREFWGPAQCDAGMSFLEIGCGTGQFLKYLHHKGVRRFVGIDLDPKVLAYIPDELAARVRIASVWDYLGDCAADGPFDRVFLLDVLEHFSAYEGVALLERIKSALAQDALVTVRVPNMASPWAAQHQYGDLTHKTAFAPGNLRQLGLAAGFDTVALVPERRGSRFRRFTEDRLHGFLSQLLTNTPPLWSPNMISVFKPKTGGATGVRAHGAKGAHTP